MTHVSVIMSTGSSRMASLIRTLRSWERVSYPNMDFTLIINADDEKAKMIYGVVKDKFSFITRLEKQNTENTNRVWRRFGMESSGEYVVFAMADELLGDYAMLDTMIQHKDQRFSVNTFFLNALQTVRLGGFDDWLDAPKIIETLPEFWSWDKFQNTPNCLRKSGGLLTHITGAYRTYWEYVNWFRNDAHGYLNLDRDLIVREFALGQCAVSPMYPCCYHQYHDPAEIAYIDRLPGYRYDNEAQARLLEFADMEKS